MKPRAEAAVLVQPEVEVRSAGIGLGNSRPPSAATTPSRTGPAGARAGWHSQRPHGGYALARERNRITADDILRAARTAEDIDELGWAV